MSKFRAWRVSAVADGRYDRERIHELTRLMVQARPSFRKLADREWRCSKAKTRCDAAFKMRLPVKPRTAKLRALDPSSASFRGTIVGCARPDRYVPGNDLANEGGVQC